MICFTNIFSFTCIGNRCLQKSEETGYLFLEANVLEIDEARCFHRFKVEERSGGGRDSIIWL